MNSIQRKTREFGLHKLPLLWVGFPDQYIGSPNAYSKKYSYNGIFLKFETKDERRRYIEALVLPYAGMIYQRCSPVSGRRFAFGLSESEYCGMLKAADFTRVHHDHLFDVFDQNTGSRSFY